MLLREGIRQALVWGAGVADEYSMNKRTLTRRCCILTYACAAYASPYMRRSEGDLILVINLLRAHLFTPGARRVIDNVISMFSSVYSHVLLQRVLI